MADSSSVSLRPHRSYRKLEESVAHQEIFKGGKASGWPVGSVPVAAAYPNTTALRDNRRQAIGVTRPWMLSSAPWIARDCEDRTFFISPGLFGALGIPLVGGRDLTWNDLYDKRPVVLISENLARQEWGSAQAALGKRVRGASDGSARLILRLLYSIPVGQRRRSASAGRREGLRSRSRRR